MTYWQRFIRVFGPVLEGGGVAVASTVVAGALTVVIGGGVVCYTLTALALAALYLRYRLR